MLSRINNKESISLPKWVLEKLSKYNYWANSHEHMRLNLFITVLNNLLKEGHSYPNQRHYEKIKGVIYPDNRKRNKLKKADKNYRSSSNWTNSIGF